MISEGIRYFIKVPLKPKYVLISVLSASLVTPLTAAETAWWKTHKLDKEEEYIVRNDRCRYFVVSQVPLEQQIRRLYTRQDCPTSGATHSFLDVDCTRLSYRIIGDSYQSPESIKPTGNGEWNPTIVGSSKYSLVNFICFPRR